MNTLHLVFAVLALIAFIADAAGATLGRLNLQSAGLALLTAAVLFT
jgi:hypothetical protein